jgi:hypothetical protein
VAQAQVNGQPAGDGAHPTGKFRAVAQQPQPAVSADERLLRHVLRERGVAKAAPGHGKDAAFVAFHEFAVAFRVAAPHGGHGGFVLLGGAGRFGGDHLTARQR